MCNSNAYIFEENSFKIIKQYIHSILGSQESWNKGTMGNNVYPQTVHNSKISKDQNLTPKTKKKQKKNKKKKKVNPRGGWDTKEEEEGTPITIH